MSSNTNIDLESVHKKLDALSETLINLRLLVGKIESGLDGSVNLYTDLLERVNNHDKEIYGVGTEKGLRTQLNDVKTEVDGLKQTKSLFLKLCVYPVLTVICIGSVLYVLTMFFSNGGSAASNVINHIP